MAPQWGDDEAHLLRLWLHHTLPGGLNQKERLTWKNVAFRMNEEARTNGITERVFNTYMIRDYYSRTLRPVYDKDFKYAGPQARVANGATDKAANYATQLAEIAARTAHRNATTPILRTLHVRMASPTGVLRSVLSCQKQMQLLGFFGANAGPIGTYHSGGQ